MLYKFPLFLFCTLCLFKNAWAQQKAYKNEFGFRSDNDSYLALGQDQYYTNGLFISFRHAVNQNTISSQLQKKIWEIEAGQYMYNSKTGKIRKISDVDRPFAAYLYAGGKISWLKKNEQIFQGSFQIGTIGPSAKGKEAQEFLHNTFGFYKISGWEYQVKDETGLNLAFDYLTLVKRNSAQNTDISFAGSVRAGNTFSGASTGILFRTGKINRLFETASTNSLVSNSSADSSTEKEIFFFAKPSLSFIAYDASIQGGMFREDKGPAIFDPKRFVFSQELGLMYSQKRWTLDFSLIFKSREVKSTAKPHQYGEASVYYRFN
ncbi:lipid A deacylase LpxR family protein [Rubrolithibacter danxiaensis]|uniref:lipid A deacylase LpxR family protein n=1 Tax=Rubrolithibacter danxiaensis TaxID=3390805 RepID=UPI003BF7D5CC